MWRTLRGFEICESLWQGRGLNLPKIEWRTLWTVPNRMRNSNFRHQNVGVGSEANAPSLSPVAKTLAVNSWMESLISEKFTRTFRMPVRKREEVQTKFRRLLWLIQILIFVFFSEILAIPSARIHVTECPEPHLVYLPALIVIAAMCCLSLGFDLYHPCKKKCQANNSARCETTTDEEKQ